MDVYELNPLTDARWPEFLERNSEASIFHTPGWLKALYITYNYEPVVYTTSGPNQDLRDGIPFFTVNSWLTGSRLVSLPFSDHCQPLVDNPDDLSRILFALEQTKNRNKWKYIELRPLKMEQAVIESKTSFRKSKEFHMHHLDITHDLEKLFGQFHRNGVRYMINRSEREGLKYSEGNSEHHLAVFYRLLVMTREKHRIPPQPIAWFRNLLKCLGDRVNISIASLNDHPVAALITLRYKQKSYYKYIGSDPRYSALGGSQMLYWYGIQKAKAELCSEVDWGRSDYDNASLVTFKNRWNTVHSKLLYYRNPLGFATYDLDKRTQLAKHIFRLLPKPVLIGVGKFLYKHMG